jgi:hypothetical protein
MADEPEYAGGMNERAVEERVVIPQTGLIEV